MASNPPAVQDGRRGERANAPRRRGFRLAVSAVSVTAGSAGGYLAVVLHLGRLAHLSIPHVALLALIVTAGVAVIVLGWRVIAYLDRRDQRRHETISRMLGEEGVYQKFEDNSSAYERWPMAAVPGGERDRGAEPPRTPGRNERPRRS